MSLASLFLASSSLAFCAFREGWWILFFDSGHTADMIYRPVLPWDHTCHITNEIKMKMSQGPKCFGHGEVWVGKIIVIHMLCHFSMGNTVSTHPNPQRLSASIELWSLCFRLVLPRMKNSQGFCMLLSYRI